MRKIYAIRDRIANDIVRMQMYSLMTFRTPQEAARYFQDAINDETSILHKHPDDFELIEVGTVTDIGEITAQQPNIIVTGSAIVALNSTQNFIETPEEVAIRKGRNLKQA